MSRFVRASKYRHVYGQPYKREICYDNLKVSSSAWDTNLAKVNASFLSVNWNASGGGAFAVLALSNSGKMTDTLPLFNGHTAAVLDTDFHPFNDHVIASAAEDCKVMLWKIPENGPIEHVSSPVATLSGHQRKVGHVLFHPTAENVLASASADFTIKVWDVEKGSECIELLGHGEIIQSLCWNWRGDQLVTTCKDKVLRVFDVRTKKPACEAQGHQGIKGSRVVWLGDREHHLATTGFSRSSDRQVCVWDTRNFAEPIKTTNLDTSSGTLIPHFDQGNSILYLAGKGDGNIRYYEYEDSTSELYYLSEYKSADPQRGIAFLPKRACNVNENEIARAYKVHTTLIEPIQFLVPRRADTFQADLFPETVGDEPSLTANEFFVDGKTAAPKLISLEKGFKATVKKEFVSSAPSDATTSSGAINGNASSDLTSEKDLQEVVKTLRTENESIKTELTQKEIRIRQLEAQLASLTLK